MPFEDVLDSIVAVKPSYKEPRYHYYGVNGNSRAGWDSIANTPIGFYQLIECREHRRKELVPSTNFHTGLLSLWYHAGVHPRFSIWQELNRDRETEFTLIMRIARMAPERLWEAELQPASTQTGLRFQKLLRKHRDSPTDFVRGFRELADEIKTVSYTIGGRSWRMPIWFRTRMKAADFTVDEFIHTRNQTQRRLMLLSRSFDVKDVLESMNKLAEDEEGAIYLDDTAALDRQHYLHVVCPTTGENYMLGIRATYGCPECRQPLWNNRGHTDECTMPHKTGWRTILLTTPAEARRASFGLAPDAKFLVEA